MTRHQPPLRPPPLAAEGRASPVPPSAWAVGRLALALLVLNAALTVHAVWPSFVVRPAAELSVELLLLLAATAAAVEAGGPLGVRGRRLLAFVFLLLAFGRYVDVTAPAVFGREINLYWDLPHLPSVLAMLAAVVPPLRLAAMAALALLAAGFVAFALRACAGALADGLARPAPRRSVAALALLGIAAFAAGRSSERIGAERWFALPVTPVYARQFAFLAEAGGDPQIAAAPPPVRLGAAALCGADVLLLFIESYGATVFDNPRLAGPLAPHYAALAEALERRGFAAASAFVTSPTFGGTSWLAHASLLSGVQVTDQRHYDLLLASGRATLPTRFQALGYRAVGLFPGLKSIWTEGAAYGFDRIYDGAALDYRGPDFGWWAIPDQFTLDALYRRELAAEERAPVFVAGAAIMSHMPFRPVPPYRPDWSALAGPAAFAPPTVAETGDLTDAYRKGIAYELDVLRGFLTERAPDDMVLLVLGDHQPLAAVSGPGASHAVPVHLIAGRPGLAARFVAAGFAPGLRPRAPSLGPMAGLHRLLLESFAQAPPCDPAG